MFLYFTLFLCKLLFILFISQNMKNMLRPGPSGDLEFTLPIPANSKFAQYSVDETGLVVREVLNNRNKFLGKKLALVGDYLSPNEMAAALSKRIYRLLNLYICLLFFYKIIIIFFIIIYFYCYYYLFFISLFIFVIIDAL